MASHENLAEGASVPKASKRKKLRAATTVLAKTLLFSNIFVLLNIVIVSSFMVDALIVTYYVSLLTILEGAVGLVIGGLTVISSGPSMTKVGEKVLHGEPYSAKRARQAEGTARGVSSTHSY